MGKGDALAVASGHKLGPEIAAVLSPHETLAPRLRRHPRRPRRGPRARAAEDDEQWHQSAEDETKTSARSQKFMFYGL